jgi:hypothetical protein
MRLGVWVLKRAGYGRSYVTDLLIDDTCAPTLGRLAAALWESRM